MIIEYVHEFMIKPKNNDSQFISPRLTHLHSYTMSRIQTCGFLHLDAYKIIQRRINCRNYHY